MDSLTALAVDPAAWAALATLVVMEVVLGIDNLIFISILSNKLPEAQRGRTQKTGIALALIMRLILLGTVALIVRLTKPIFFAFDHGFSWRDLILIAGGLFLVWKRRRRSIITLPSRATTKRPTFLHRRPRHGQRSDRSWRSIWCFRSTAS